MKALGVFPRHRTARIIDHPEPTVESPTQVKLRILEVGVCGTDREISAFDYGEPPVGSDYLIIGHEALGEVVEVGSQVRGLKPGDLAVPMVRRPCPDPACTPCQSGRQDFCDTGCFTERGIKGAHGFLCEYVVDEACYLHSVSAELRDVMVLVEPLTIAEKALTQLWQVQQRLPWACPVVPGKAPGHCHRAVVFGAGPVGLLGAMVFQSAAFDLYVYSREPEDSLKARIAQEIGASYVSGTRHRIEDLDKAIQNIDVVYEAAGASSASFELMEHLGTNGVFIFTGVPGRKAPTEMDTDLLMRNLVLRNQVAFGSVNAGPESYKAAIRDLELFMGGWPSAVRSLITGRYRMEDYEELFLGSPGGIKNVVTLGER